MFPKQQERIQFLLERASAGQEALEQDIIAEYMEKFGVTEGTAKGAIAKQIEFGRIAHGRPRRTFSPSASWIVSPSKTLVTKTLA